MREMAYYKKFVKESIMKNLVLGERKNQKLQERENFNKFVKLKVKSRWQRLSIFVFVNVFSNSSGKLLNNL